jgi:hypothetical protein
MSNQVNVLSAFDKEKENWIACFCPEFNVYRINSIENINLIPTVEEFVILLSRLFFSYSELCHPLQSHLYDQK